MHANRQKVGEAEMQGLGRIWHTVTIARTQTCTVLHAPRVGGVHDAGALRGVGTRGELTRQTLPVCRQPPAVQAVQVWLAVQVEMCIMIGPKHYRRYMCCIG